MSSRCLFCSLCVVSLLAAGPAWCQDQAAEPLDPQRAEELQQAQQFEQAQELERTQELEQTEEQERAQALESAQESEPPPGTEQEKSFNLVHDRGATDIVGEDEEEIEPPFEPRIEAGKIEVSMTIGFLNLNQTLLQHDSIIYKVGEDNIYWGDTEMVGESAFNPVVRVGYTLTPWITLEGIFGVSFSEYQAEITNRYNLDLRTGFILPDPELGEYDAEHRSLVTLSTGIGALWYPLNMSDRVTRFQPYVQGGLSRMWYDMNSNYTDGSTATTNVALGGGIRYIADDLISVRLDVTFNYNQLQFTPAPYFEELAEGTVQVPLITLPDGNEVTEYEAQDMAIFAWAIGFFASF